MYRSRQHPRSVEERPHYLVRLVTKLVAYMAAAGFDPVQDDLPQQPYSPSDDDVEEFFVIPSDGQTVSLLDSRGEHLYRWNATEGRFYCETPTTWLEGPRPVCGAQPGDIHYHRPVSVGWRRAARMELRMRYFCASRREGWALPETQFGGVFYSRQSRKPHQENLLHALFEFCHRMYPDVPVRLVYEWAKEVENTSSTTIRSRALRSWTDRRILPGFPSPRRWQVDQAAISMSRYFCVDRRVEDGPILSGFVDMETVRRIHGLVRPVPVVVDAVDPNEAIADVGGDEEPMEVDQENRVEPLAPRVPPPGPDGNFGGQQMEVDEETRVEPVVPRVSLQAVAGPAQQHDRRLGEEDLSFMLQHHPVDIRMPVPVPLVPVADQSASIDVPAIRLPPLPGPLQTVNRMAREVREAVTDVFSSLSPTAPPQPWFDEDHEGWYLPPPYGPNEPRRLEVITPSVFFRDFRRIKQIYYEDDPLYEPPPDDHHYLYIEYLDDDEADIDGLFAWYKVGGAGSLVTVDHGAAQGHPVSSTPRHANLATRLVGEEVRAQQRRNEIPGFVPAAAVGQDAPQRPNKWAMYMVPAADIEHLRSICSVHQRRHPADGYFPGRVDLIVQYFRPGERGNDGLYAATLGAEL